MRKLQISRKAEAKSNESSRPHGNLDSLKLSEEKARVCCVENMKNIVLNQMVGSLTVRLNTTYADGKISLSAPPEYVHSQFKEREERI